MKIIRSKIFDTWLSSLRDTQWKYRILARIKMIGSAGYFGDTKRLDKGVSELRFRSGSGFRVYYSCHKDEVIILPCGGDKGSQQRDIQKAIVLANIYQ